MYICVKYVYVLNSVYYILYTYSKYCILIRGICIVKLLLYDIYTSMLIIVIIVLVVLVIVVISY